MRAVFVPSLAVTAALAIALTAVPAAQTTMKPEPKAQPKTAAKAPAQTKGKTPVNANAATIADFLKRVDEYVALHKKAESSIPALPKDADPKQMDAHERAMQRLVQEARKGAKQGDIFTPAMQQLVRKFLLPVFSGRGGAQIRDEILDKESKAAVTLTPNGRYPDEIPISTVPPQVLAQLPKLPEEIEYRFVRDNMILFDPHAHTIPDWVPNAFK